MSDHKPINDRPINEAEDKPSEEQPSLFDRFSKMLAKLWQWLKQNRQHLFRLLVVLILLFGLKKGLLDRYISLTKIEQLIKEGSFRKVLLGSMLIIGFLKDKPWYKSFVFGSIYPR